MSQSNSIKLPASCILNVPLENYEKDFSFIVNGEEFKTSKTISDLISPIISRNHSIDPTFDRFTIDTKERGDFSNVLKLINFKSNNYPESELPFLFEVIEILGNDFIEPEASEITIDNVIDNLCQHQKNSKFYSRFFFTRN